MTNNVNEAGAPEDRRAQEANRLYGEPGVDLSRPFLPMKMWDRFRYILVTDGWVGPGKFAQALALGAVVLKPVSHYRQYYEDALVPYKHFVPVWDTDLHDVKGKLAWLEANPSTAASIAAAGRRFACEQLSRRARACWWAEAIDAARGLMGYSVDEALIERRRAYLLPGASDSRRGT